MGQGWGDQGPCLLMAAGPGHLQHSAKGMRQTALPQRTFGEEKEKQLGLTIEMRVRGWNAIAEVPGGIFFF